ncbi:MAG: dipeptide ABC transporter ATP-binding protein [Deltaproteobacteria bacterium]|nr:dipeptide ABC transporter ATP-binding protein [Deltaproteobacteria bacterium]
MANQPPTPNPQPLVQVRNLKKHFPVRSGVFSRISGWVKAVDDVSFIVQSGETLALVGESGCGKTTVGRSILRLIEPTSGEVHFAGEDVLKMGTAQLRQKRRHMQMIFQDPYSSLNPRMTVGAIIGEPLRVHGLANGTNLDRQVHSLLERVGLSSSYASRYPHEFSGGQRQRIGIARALALNPQFIVCDEPVSALDVSIQAQILNLLEDLQQEFGLSYLFVSHDLNVVEHIADRVAVMYLGKIVEIAPVDKLFRNPQHPYTVALMSANPVPDPTIRTKRQVLTGDVPSALNPPTGCPFHTRCPRVMETCKTVMPQATQTGEEKETHTVWCHLYSETANTEV